MRVHVKRSACQYPLRTHHIFMAFLILVDADVGLFSFPFPRKQRFLAFDPVRASCFGFAMVRKTCQEAILVIPTVVLCVDLGDEEECEGHELQSIASGEYEYDERPHLRCCFGGEPVKSMMPRAKGAPTLLYTIPHRPTQEPDSAPAKRDARGRSQNGRCRLANTSRHSVQPRGCTSQSASMQRLSYDTRDQHLRSPNPASHRKGTRTPPPDLTFLLYSRFRRPDPITSKPLVGEARYVVLAEWSKCCGWSGRLVFTLSALWVKSICWSLLALRVFGFVLSLDSDRLIGVMYLMFGALHRQPSPIWHWCTVVHHHPFNKAWWCRS